MLKNRIFGLNLLSEYDFEFKNLLLVQNFHITFNSVGAIISNFEKWVVVKNTVVDWMFSFSSLHESTME